MEHNSDNYILQSDDSYIIPSKTIYKSPVQIADLDQLNWHVERMQIPEVNIDFFSLFAGAALTSVAQFVYDIRNGTVSILYLVFCLAFFLAAMISYYIQRIRKNEDNPRHLVKEIRHDLETIYEKAGIPFPNQYARARESADQKVSADK